MIVSCATFKVAPVFDEEPHAFLCVARHCRDECMIGVGATAPEAQTDCVALLQDEGFAEVRLDECTDERERRALIQTATLSHRAFNSPIRAIDELRALARAFGNGHDVWN